MRAAGAAAVVQESVVTRLRKVSAEEIGWGIRLQVGRSLLSDGESDGGAHRSRCTPINFEATKRSIGESDDTSDTD